MYSKAQHTPDLPLWRWATSVVLVILSITLDWMLLQGAVSSSTQTSANVAVAAACNAPSMATSVASNVDNNTIPLVNVSDIHLFVGVLSKAANSEGRGVVRETWGADSRLGRLMFFVLRPNDSTVYAQLQEEAAARGDVVVLTEIDEHYHNITYATLEIFKTATRIGNFTHVVKTDDDAYVRWSLLYGTLIRMPQQRLYAGNPMGVGRVTRGKHKRAVPLTNWKSNLPVKYAFGLGYVLSMDLVREIALGVAHTVMPPDNLLILEDFSVGLWVEALAKQQQQPINYKTYLTGESKKCTDKQVFVHIVSNPASQMIRCMHEKDGQCCPHPVAKPVGNYAKTATVPTVKKLPPPLTVSQNWSAGMMRTGRV